MNEPIDDNLKSLKRDYDALKYPGDLASQVSLDAGRSSIAGRIGPLLALAAVLAMSATVWLMWPAETGAPQQAAAPVERGSVVESTTSTVVAVPALTATAQSVASIAVPQTSELEVPTWTDMTPVTGFSSTATVSMPYQSIAMPTIAEIEQAISSENQQMTNDQSL